MHRGSAFLGLGLSIKALRLVITHLWVLFHSLSTGTGCEWVLACVTKSYQTAQFAGNNISWDEVTVLGRIRTWLDEVRWLAPGIKDELMASLRWTGLKCLRSSWAWKDEYRKWSKAIDYKVWAPCWICGQSYTPRFLYSNTICGLC